MLYVDLEAQRCLSKIKEADILIGIPSLKRSDHIKKNLLLDGLKCIWTARVATFVRDTSEEAKAKVEEDAMQFEKLKSALLKVY